MLVLLIRFNIDRIKMHTSDIYTLSTLAIKRAKYCSLSLGETNYNRVDNNNNKDIIGLKVVLKIKEYQSPHHSYNDNESLLERLFFSS